jgi:hypothetical protein
MGCTANDRNVWTATIRRTPVIGRSSLPHIRRYALSLRLTGSDNVRSQSWMTDEVVMSDMDGLLEVLSLFPIQLARWEVRLSENRLSENRTIGNLGTPSGHSPGHR